MGLCSSWIGGEVGYQVCGFDSDGKKEVEIKILNGVNSKKLANIIKDYYKRGFTIAIVREFTWELERNERRKELQRN